jgi:hypothetical protein
LGVPHGTSHIENLQSHEFRLAPCRGGVWPSHARVPPGRTSEATAP